MKYISYGQEIEEAKFDLFFEVFETVDRMIFDFRYSTKLFKKETIELMRDRFLILIESILNNKESKIQDLEYRVLIEQELGEKKFEDIEFDF